MKIGIYSNWARPGVGLKPRMDSQRHLLPQHSRHCPVLTAANALGYLVYPPLEANEGFQVHYHGEGAYSFHFFTRNAKGDWSTLFTVALRLAVGSIGAISEDVRFGTDRPPISADGAKKIMRAFIVPEDLGTPQGAVTLRGAWNFRTPEGWDSVYLPVLNMIERPIAPMLSIRVETDWYPHDSEFRYVLQAGEGLPGSRHLPIGQVHFVPRQELELYELSSAEVSELRDSKREFLGEKAQLRKTTPQGLEFSPLYARRSRLQSQPPGEEEAAEGESA
jgi:hypothetical protein